LFATLDVATGRITIRCAARHCQQEFLGFLQQEARAYPRRQLQVVCDNYATRRHPAARARLASHPPHPAALHPNLSVVAEPVEGFFSILERQALRRGDLRQGYRPHRRSTRESVAS
jgi:hypothetical protein